MVDQVTQVINQLDSFTERLITKITLDVTANLVEATPVDTGWARANWVAQIGRPFVEDLSAVTPDGQAAASAGQRQAASLGNVASSYRLQRGAVFVSNNVPYIMFLNEGSSQQAPSGFVQRAIAKAVTQDILSLRA